jgi:hypothetical protein
MAALIRAALSPGFLWPEGTPPDPLRLGPSAHNRIRLTTDTATQTPPMPPGWTLAAQALYRAQAQNALSGPWMDKEQRLHLAYMRIASAPSSPNISPPTKDAP